MDIKGKTTWQIAAGDTNRHYADLCLDWDVVVIGPGYGGRWPECEKVLNNSKETSRKISTIRRFAETIKDGDYVVLRIGTSTVYGFGQIVGDYDWHEEFGDIDGWNLNHCRRVQWFWKGKKTPKQFDAYTMKLGDSVQLLNSPPIEEWVRTLSIDQETLKRDPVKLPDPSNEIDDFQEVWNFLYDKGVANHVIKGLADEIEEMIRLTKWYQRTEIPSEFETVTNLVVPLLRALGWTPQKMAIEWSNIDIALFDKLPRDNKNVSVVVEAKRGGRSCLSAMPQALSYAEHEERTSCHRLIVTDGIRYGVYIRGADGFQNKLAAYLNLSYMRDAYPIMHCDKGAKEALLLMSADWTPDDA